MGAPAIPRSFLGPVIGSISGRTGGSVFNKKPQNAGGLQDFYPPVLPPQFRKRKRPELQRNHGVLLSCDQIWVNQTEAWRDKWRKAIKRPHLSGYALWMREAMSCAFANLNLPDDPSASGGFSTRALVPGDTWYIDDCGKPQPVVVRHVDLSPLAPAIRRGSSVAYELAIKKQDESIDTSFNGTALLSLVGGDPADNIAPSDVTITNGVGSRVSIITGGAGCDPTTVRASEATSATTDDEQTTVCTVGAPCPRAWVKIHVFIDRAVPACLGLPNDDIHIDETIVIPFGEFAAGRNWYYALGEWRPYTPCDYQVNAWMYHSVAEGTYVRVYCHTTWYGSNPWTGAWLYCRSWPETDWCSVPKTGTLNYHNQDNAHAPRYIEITGWGP